MNELIEVLKPRFDLNGATVTNYNNYWLKCQTGKYNEK